MAGDWIKWVKGLHERREVAVMAELLELDTRMVAEAIAASEGSAAAPLWHAHQTAARLVREKRRSLMRIAEALETRQRLTVQEVRPLLYMDEFADLAA